MGLGLLDGIKAISAQISWRLAGWLGQSLSMTQNVKKASKFKITPRVKVSALVIVSTPRTGNGAF